MPYDNKLHALEPGNFIINTNPFEAFLTVMNKAKELYKIEFCYAHNGSKYDTKLLLSYIINNSIPIHFTPLINNGRLISLDLEL
jgi:hypothetical protein